MAYDAQKAHEYYEKYRKKGILKGRSKGKKRSSSTKKKSGLLGVSTAGLNDAGKIEAALIKEKIAAELAQALSGASDKDRDNIRREYSRKAQQEIAALKNKKEYAKPKKSKKKASTKKTSKKKVSKEKKQSLKNSIETIKKVLPTATDAQKKQIVELVTDLLEAFGVTTHGQSEGAGESTTGADGKENT